MTRERSDRERVLPFLREEVSRVLRPRGFTGDVPHLRRRGGSRIDLVTFQFDKHGGGFIVEIGQWPSHEPVTYQGEGIPYEKLTSWSLPAEYRARLRRSHRSLPESWFRYEKTLFRRSESRFTRVSHQVAELLPQVLAWFDGSRPQPNIKEYSRERRAVQPPSGPSHQEVAVLSGERDARRR